LGCLAAGGEVERERVTDCLVRAAADCARVTAPAEVTRWAGKEEGESVGGVESQ
jgi:hypothetical protein